MIDVNVRNREVKNRLSKVFGRQNVSVKGGRGTAYGWCEIEIKAIDPCPDKQHVNPCSSYCTNGVCKGNNQPINGGWGNTVRSIKHKEITDKAEGIIKDIEFYSYCDDMGGSNKEVIVEVKFEDQGQG